MSGKLHKHKLKALERLFAAEIDDRYPVQSKSRVFQELCDQGLAKPMERVFGAGERFAVRASGFQLTDAGRLAYCASCKEEAI
jgi:hypothetical protein